VLERKVPWTATRNIIGLNVSAVFNMFLAAEGDGKNLLRERENLMSIFLDLEPRKNKKEKGDPFWKKLLGFSVEELVRTTRTTLME
jgi:hypothetical protein